MIKYAVSLKNVTLFSKLKDGEIQAITRIAILKNYEKNSVVFQEGEIGDSLYIVLAGRVKVSLFDDDGKEYILDVIEKDGFFGELSIIDELPRSANVITTEYSEFLVINRKDFIRLLLDNPTISVNILKTLSARLRYADERIKGLAFLSVEERVLTYLLDIGEKYGLRLKDHIIIENGPTQIEIANSCGTSRETVSRVLKILIKRGAISIRKKQYTLYPHRKSI
ncbi:MAG TPA: Crp/Fnr family transcriptional regulator [Syntrophorhabdaceae bacterium]|jgi:CRP-like cAMP-binding protein|nr:MAG: cAMP receptor protein [Deltaproteobacteria bacterium ADurb.Bin026]HNQ62658.1 Crp/Fnr family transcriptional regulator [Syntrophorhabdaceae bacterium]HNZ57867.1 Crp/Fnr family transcriptional regulator [Syntrophorhabdaceae bacterium]HOB68240.1 Crp/Fnr family transcriptional regulator [Syntrophorhabdaceae bacterium]HOF56822.1 Crp/Fnr family transcriptional regulator [Syntrophorhabdaceae bacterium]